MPSHNILPFARPPAPLAPSSSNRGAPSAPPPTPSARRPVRMASPVETGGRRGEYGIGDLARQLRMPDWTIRTIVRKLRVLARDAGMPLPTTPRILHSGRGVILNGLASIHFHSRWDAARWDAWHIAYEQGLAPGGALPAPIVPPPVRARMAQLAEQIGRGA